MERLRSWCYVHNGYSNLICPCALMSANKGTPDISLLLIGVFFNPSRMHGGISIFTFYCNLILTLMENDTH
jgi:hypothetical protein